MDSPHIRYGRKNDNLISVRHHHNVRPGAIPDGGAHAGDGQRHGGVQRRRRSDALHHHWFGEYCNVLINAPLMKVIERKTCKLKGTFFMSNTDILSRFF